MADEKRSSWNAAVQRAGVRPAPPQDVIGDSRWWTPESQQERRTNRTQGFSVRSREPSRAVRDWNSTLARHGLAPPQVQVPRRGTPEYDAMVADQQMRQSDELRRARAAEADLPDVPLPDRATGTGLAYIDRWTPNVWGPLAEIATAAIETPDYVRALLGDAAAARYIAGQPARALELSRDLRSVGEAITGPEDAAGMANRLDAGEGGVQGAMDAVLLPLSVLPGPTGRAVKGLVVDPLRAAARRIGLGGTATRVMRALSPYERAAPIDPHNMSRDEWLQTLAVARRDAPIAPVGARGVHYSRAEGLQRTDPSFYGTGHIGEERRMVRREGLPDRTYFYAEGADGTPIRPEEPVAQRAPYVYEADLQGLYDVNADPEGLVALANRYNPEGTAIPDLERLIQQYGYSGYISDYAPSWAPQSRRAAAMFEPVDVRRAP